jgi:hypothetical protein
MGRTSICTGVRCAHESVTASSNTAITDRICDTALPARLLRVGKIVPSFDGSE